MSFTCLKRRELYVSHLPPIYTEAMKQSLLSSPVSLGSALFREEDVERLSTLADRTLAVKSNQSVVDTCLEPLGILGALTAPPPDCLLLGTDPVAGILNLLSQESEIFFLSSLYK